MMFSISQAPCGRRRVMCPHPVIKAHLLLTALLQKGTRCRAPFVPLGSRGRARGRRETKQKENHSKTTSLALQKPSAIICRMRITNLAQFSSHMLQDLVSLQLFYFKHPHDTKEFAIFFLLAKIHNHQQFQFSYLIFFLTLPLRAAKPCSAVWGEAGRQQGWLGCRSRRDYSGCDKCYQACKRLPWRGRN